VKIFGFNQPVTLISDRTFLGYIWAQVVDESGVEQVMVSVKHPGKTKHHLNSNVALPEADVEPTEERKARAKETIS